MLLVECISEFMETVDLLRSKIIEYRDEFSRNEMLVRYALIDPFLRSLGWDTENPSQVVPEYSTEAGVPDYALKMGDKIIALVEAKALGKPWDPLKLVSYANTKGVPYVIITDGDEWRIYEVFKPVNFDEKLIASWSFRKNSSAEIVLRSLMIANLGEALTFGKPYSKPILIERLEKGKQPSKSKVKGPITTKKARELILRVLSDHKKPLNVRDILNEISRMFEPTESDLEILSGKEERWKNRVRWQLSKMTKERFIKRLREGVYEL